jgi:hypothetical protein
MTRLSHGGGPDTSFRTAAGGDLRELSAVPDGDDPHIVFMHSVEEAIGRDDDFSVGEFGELRKCSSGVRVTGQSLQDRFRSSTESDCGCAVVATNVV